MFRNVPKCSGMFHVPGFIDALEKLHRLCEYTLISFKCQSIRSKVHGTNKTLHNESLKNVTVQLGPRVTCAKNMTRYTDSVTHSVLLLQNVSLNANHAGA